MPAPRLRLPADPPRGWPRFDERLRAVAVTARLGRVLGIAIGISFVTGLLSHYQYQPWSWLPEPAHPSWGYRFTQGLHVTTGIASIPLLLTGTALLPERWRRGALVGQVALALVVQTLLHPRW